MNNFSQRKLARLLNRSPSTECFAPEQLAGKLRSMEFPQFEDAYVCRETIYNAIIKGKVNASAVGTLVERTRGYLMLVRMNDATATSAVEGFSAALNRMPLAVRKSMTYGREMVRYAQITQKIGGRSTSAIRTAPDSAAATGTSTA